MQAYWLRKIIDVYFYFRNQSAVQLLQHHQYRLALYLKYLSSKVKKNAILKFYLLTCDQLFYT